jgi:hypothetical protein
MVYWRHLTAMWLGVVAPVSSNASSCGGHRGRRCKFQRIMRSLLARLTLVPRGGGGPQHQSRKDEDLARHVCHAAYDGLHGAGKNIFVTLLCGNWRAGRRRMADARQGGGGGGGPTWGFLCHPPQPTLQVSDYRRTRRTRQSRGRKPHEIMHTIDTCRGEGSAAVAGCQLPSNPHDNAQPPPTHHPKCNQCERAAANHASSPNKGRNYGEFTFSKQSARLVHVPIPPRCAHLQYGC